MLLTFRADLSETVRYVSWVSAVNLLDVCSIRFHLQLNVNFTYTIRLLFPKFLFFGIFLFLSICVF